MNASGVKIGADELPADTQLFTEPYMVEFLPHNSLGAWWQTRHPGVPCPVELTYLRTVSSPSPLWLPTAQLAIRHNRRAATLRITATGLHLRNRKICPNKPGHF